MKAISGFVLGVTTLIGFGQVFAANTCDGISLKQMNEPQGYELICQSRVYVTDKHGKQIGNALVVANPTRCIAKSNEIAVQGYLCGGQCKPGKTYYLVDENTRCTNNAFLPVENFSSDLNSTAFSAIGDAYRIRQAVKFDHAGRHFRKITPAVGTIYFSVKQSA